MAGVPMLRLLEQSLQLGRFVDVLTSLKTNLQAGGLERDAIAAEVCALAGRSAVSKDCG